MKKLLSKSTLTELAGLGIGAVAAGYVKSNVLTKEDGTPRFGEGKTGEIITSVAPVAVGLFLQGQGTLLKEAGKGMIAVGVGSLIGKQVGVSIGGVAEGGDVMMQGSDESPMMSGIGFAQDVAAYGSDEIY